MAYTLEQPNFVSLLLSQYAATQFWRVVWIQFTHARARKHTQAHSPV